MRSSRNPATFRTATASEVRSISTMSCKPSRRSWIDVKGRVGFVGISCLLGDARDSAPARPRTCLLPQPTAQLVPGHTSVRRLVLLHAQRPDHPGLFMSRDVAVVLIRPGRSVDDHLFGFA